jgi:hypothetical protein
MTDPKLSVAVMGILGYKSLAEKVSLRNPLFIYLFYFIFILMLLAILISTLCRNLPRTWARSV